MQTNLEFRKNEPIKYDKLTLTKKVKIGKYWFYEGICECGNKVIKRVSYIKYCLKIERKISCGKCLQNHINIGDKFHYLTVIEKLPSIKVSNKIRGYWLLKCKCGNFHKSTTDLLNAGKVKSCGCYYKESRYIKWKPEVCFLFKKCPNCKKELHHSYFGKEKTRRGGLKSFCKKCVYSSKDYSKVAANNFLRKKRIKQSTPKWVNKKEILKIHKIKFELEKIVNVKLNVDHIFPIVHKDYCGLTVPNNLQITTEKFNTSKQNNIETTEIKILLKGSMTLNNVTIHKSVLELLTKEELLDISKKLNVA